MTQPQHHRLEPVEHNPFAKPEPSHVLVPVPHNPFTHKVTQVEHNPFAKKKESSDAS